MAIENLMTASQTIGKIMYEEAAKQAGAAGGGVGPGAHAGHGPSDEAGEPVGAGAEGRKKDEDVIDAEFEVKE